VTISVSIPTVTASIAGLNVSGVTIKDITAIPDSSQMLCPILIPQPNGFITDVAPSFETFGSNGGAKLNLGYTLNYVFLHSEGGVNTFANYSDLIAKLVLIMNAIFGNDAISGLVDMKINAIGDIGLIEDPAGNQFWGVLFSLRCLEYVQ
jgi:hypothetical protein